MFEPSTTTCLVITVPAYDAPVPKPLNISAVLWDFGGVILSSPFEAFNRYEREHGLPLDFIRSVNATDPHTNAWARLERSELSPAGFDTVFAEESAVLGHRIPGIDVEVDDGDRYRFEYQGRRQIFSEHITLGGGYPKECMSIHFLWDEARGMAIIGYFGEPPPPSEDK